VWCRRYTAQIQLLRKATKALATANAAAPLKLSEEAREQLSKRLEEALKNPPSSSQ
jgi:hypothetical protein